MLHVHTIGLFIFLLSFRYQTTNRQFGGWTNWVFPVKTINSQKLCIAGSMFWLSFAWTDKCQNLNFVNILKIWIIKIWIFKNWFLNFFEKSNFENQILKFEFGIWFWGVVGLRWCLNRIKHDFSITGFILFFIFIVICLRGSIMSSLANITLLAKT